MSNPAYEHSLTIDGVCLIVEYEWCPVDNVIWQINSIRVEGSDKNIESLLSDGTIDQVCASIYSCRKEEEEEAKWGHLV
jgi:hypothetical protein